MSVSFLQIGTEKALLFWRTAVTCRVRATTKRMIFESKECIVKSAYCVRKYVLHIPQWKYFSIQCSPIYERILLLEWYRPFVLLVRTACGWKWVWSIGGAMLTGKPEVLWEKPTVEPLCTPQIPHELAWLQKWASRGRWLTLSATVRRKNTVHHWQFYSPVFKDSVRTAQETHSVSVIRTNQLILYREIMVVCSEIHTKHIKPVCGQNVELLNVKLAVQLVTTGVQRVKSLL